LFWNLIIISDHSLRLPPDHLASNLCQVRAINVVSIANVVVCDRAVFEHIETYHGLEITFGGTGNHAHEVTSTRSLLYLFFCIILKVLVDSVDVKLMHKGRGRRRRIVLNTYIIDHKISRLRVLFKVNNVKAIGCGMEFHDPSRGMNLKDTFPAVAVICCVNV
jgi:hypothetical protein